MSPASQLVRLAALLGVLLVAVPSVTLSSDSAPLHQAGALFPDDDRLSQVVTVAAHGEPLADLLPRIKVPGALRLAAGPETAGERVTLFTREQPLREVMAAFANLLNARWRASEEIAPSRYSLGRDHAAEEFERRLWRATLEVGAAPLFRLVAYSRWSPEAWERQRASLGGQPPPDPLLRGGNLGYLAHPPSHAALRLLNTLAPAERQSLLDTGRCLLFWEGMSPEQRELARAILDDPLRFGADLARGDDPDNPEVTRKSLAENQGWIERFGLALLVETDPATGTVTSFQASPGGIRGQYGVFMHMGPGKPLLPVRGRPDEQWPRARATDFHYLQRLPFPLQFPVNTSSRRPWPRVVGELARSLSMPIYSDDYPASISPGANPAEPPTAGAQLTLPEGLNALCQATRRLWWWENGVLFFRNRNWFVDKQYEVPLSVLNTLAVRLGTRPEVDAPLLNLLAGLTPRQLQGLARGAVSALPVDDRVGIAEAAHADAVAAFDYLRFFRNLSAPQQRQVLTPAGLSLRDLPPAQAKAFLQLAVLQDGRDILNDLPALRFMVRGEPPLQPAIDGEPWALPLIFSSSLKGTTVRCLVGYRPHRRNPERANHRGARYDRFTRWPAGFRPEEHGARLVESRLVE